MASYRLSSSAVKDLNSIAKYTLRIWGQEQAERYLGSLESCMKLLASTPNLGRGCSHIRPEFRRFEYKRHVIFYRPVKGGIFVGRILHERMRADRQVIEDI
jgi:toxin ParE1/3/4